MAELASDGLGNLNCGFENNAAAGLRRRQMLVGDNCAAKSPDGGDLSAPSSFVRCCLLSTVIDFGQFDAVVKGGGAILFRAR